MGYKSLKTYNDFRPSTSCDWNYKTTCLDSDKGCCDKDVMQKCIKTLKENCSRQCCNSGNVWQGGKRCQDCTGKYYPPAETL